MSLQFQAKKPQLLERLRLAVNLLEILRGSLHSACQIACEHVFDKAAMGSSGV